MTLEHGLWKIGVPPIRLEKISIKSEELLEDMIEISPEIIDFDMMIISRQVKGDLCGEIDLLAVNANGDLIIIELKKQQTPRDVVGQAIDYASWIETLQEDEIEAIYKKYKKSNAANLKKDIIEKFNIPDPDSLKINNNSSHKIIIVASVFDNKTKRIIQYLQKRNVDINAVFFNVFENNGEQIITRSWLVEENEEESSVKSISTKKIVPWNGEYYVNYIGENRFWDEMAVKYGFISGGGGKFYSQTLKKLKVGDHIWVNIPRKGYAGYGIVKEESVSAKDFMVQENGEEILFIDLPIGVPYRKNADNPETAEYFVKVEWIKTIPLNEIQLRAKLFGNQNTVCAPKTEWWIETVKELRKIFNIENTV